MKQVLIGFAALIALLGVWASACSAQRCDDNCAPNDPICIPCDLED